MKGALALLSLTACLGCSPELELPSEIKGLRVLAVQKSLPYAKPGETVTLRMLWHDGMRRGTRPSILWLPGCVNPAGDLYYGCFPQLADLFSKLGSGEPPPPGFAPGVDTDTFDFTLPTTILDRPRPLDPTQPPYGIAFIFFMTCMGDFAPAETSGQLVFPIACKSKTTGETLGSNDFVAGFSAIYAYDNFQNANPQITGFRFKDGDVPTNRLCIGAACVNNESPPTDLVCGQDPCVNACADDGDESCPGTAIQPIVPESSSEVDQISLQTRGRNYREQMWINYYVDRGGVKSEARLFSDALKGPISDYGTLFRAPKEPGPVNVFAVVHDNRGGVEWARTTILVVP